MIVQMAGSRELLRKNVAVVIDAAQPETWVGFNPILAEIEAVLDQRRARERVVAHAIAANPWVHERQRKHKQRQKNPFAACESERNSAGVSIVARQQVLVCLQESELRGLRCARLRLSENRDDRKRRKRHDFVDLAEKGRQQIQHAGSARGRKLCAAEFVR